MPQLIVTEKIDGNPRRVAMFRLQPGLLSPRLTTQQRNDKVNAEFKSHMEENHKGESPRPPAYAAAVPLSKD